MSADRVAASGSSPTGAPRDRNAPTKRECELANEISVAAHDLTYANNYAERYMARVALDRAIEAYRKWINAGRPSRG